MNRPSTRTMFLGHPVVAIPAALVCVTGLFAAYQGGSDAAALGLISAVLLGGVGKAVSDATAFKNWQREWDAMAGEVAAPGAKLKGFGKTVLAGMLVVGGFAFIGGHPDAVGPLALAAGAPLVALFAIGMWLRARRSSARLKGAAPVQVVAKRTGPVPTLDAAYDGLPENLKHLMGRSGQ